VDDKKQQCYILLSLVVFPMLHARPKNFGPLPESWQCLFKLKTEKREYSYIWGPLNDGELASLACCAFSLQCETGGILVLITSLNTVQDFPEKLTLTRAVFCYEHD
jgi:hypothetical protein